jgi:formylglycine-generating enzyme required for sulfatase activity
MAKTIDLGNGLKLELMLIPSGEFLMGAEHFADEDENVNWIKKWRGNNISGYNFKDEYPQHKVTISHPFYIGKFEVTQEQYENIMGKNPSTFTGSKKPVENVSWNEAQEFCIKLSKKTGEEFRLPTEAEWEYACRAGSTTRFYFGDDETFIRDYEWYGFVYLNVGLGPHPVGQNLPNAFGIYDMGANVIEWCSDWYGDYPSGEITDPTGPLIGDSRVMRGGSVGNFDPNCCRSSSRGGTKPDYPDDSLGFRVCCNVRRNP